MACHKCLDWSTAEKEDLFYKWCKTQARMKQRLVGKTFFILDERKRMIFSSGRGSRSKEEKRRDGGNFQPNGYHLSFLVPRGELEVVPSMNLLLHSKIHKYEVNCQSVNLMLILKGLLVLWLNNIIITTNLSFFIWHCVSGLS